MKKIVLILPVLALFLAGCSLGGRNETITCSNSETEEGMTTATTVEVVIEKNVFKTVETTIKMSGETEEVKNNLALVATFMGATTEALEEEPGVDVTTDLTDDSYTFSMLLTMEDMETEDAEELETGLPVGYIDMATEDIVEEMEASGFTCTVK